MKKFLEEIANKHLDIPTLETRRSDSLDFYDVSVWGVKKALIEAFNLGRRDSLNKLKEESHTSLIFGKKMILVDSIDEQLNNLNS